MYAPGHTLTSFTWHGIFDRRVCPPAHILSVSTVQGGHENAAYARPPLGVVEVAVGNAAAAVKVPPSPPLNVEVAVGGRPSSAAAAVAAVGWQVCQGGCGCPQGLGSVHRRGHSGGRVPHGRGGGRTVAPHVHARPELWRGCA